MKYISILFLLAFILSCTSKNETKQILNNLETDNETEQIKRTIDIPEPDILERLSSQKNVLDSLLFKKQLLKVTYIKEYDKKAIKKPLDILLDDKRIENIYSVYENSKGKIKVIKEHPHSGEKDNFYTYYFDDNGLTFAFEMLSFKIFILEDSKAITVKETLLNFYDKNFNKIDWLNSFTDDYGKVLDKEKYSKDDFSYTISSSFKTFFKANELQ